MKTNELLSSNNEIFTKEDEAKGLKPIQMLRDGVWKKHKVSQEQYDEFMKESDKYTADNFRVGWPDEDRSQETNIYNEVNSLDNEIFTKEDEDRGLKQIKLLVNNKWIKMKVTPEQFDDFMNSNKYTAENFQIGWFDDNATQEINPLFSHHIRDSGFRINENTNPEVVKLSGETLQPNVSEVTNETTS